MAGEVWELVLIAVIQRNAFHLTGIGVRLQTMEIHIGIDAAHRQKIADQLSKVLADTYTLYLKTHNFHWNVTGPQFQTLHLMFEQHYNELALAADVLAERRFELLDHRTVVGEPAPVENFSYLRNEFFDVADVRLSDVQSFGGRD